MKKVWIIGASLLFLLLQIACSEQKKSETEYFQLAKEFMDQQNWNDAEINFEKICKEYPKGEHYSRAIFMIGYINANHTRNYEKARKYYNDFLEKFPDDELSVAAKYELENMGKSPDELPFLNEKPGKNAISGNEQQETSSKMN